MITFAKDGYINRELRAYQKTLDEPWLDRLTVLKYKGGYYNYDD